jgi:hypothetical protein
MLSLSKTIGLGDCNRQNSVRKALAPFYPGEALNQRRSILGNSMSGVMMRGSDRERGIPELIAQESLSILMKDQREVYPSTLTVVTNRA